MRHKALIAIACVLVLGLVSAPTMWPAFHEPANHTCTGEDDGSWSYKVGFPGEWNCHSLGWHIGRYGFSGI